VLVSQHGSRHVSLQSKVKASVNRTQATFGRPLMFRGTGCVVLVTLNTAVPPGFEGTLSVSHL